MDWWIRNCFFVLWIPESEMHHLWIYDSGLVFFVMDSWIRNGLFELWIIGSRIMFLTYGFMDPKCNDFVSFFLFVEAWTVVMNLNKNYMMGLICGMMMILRSHYPCSSCFSSSLTCLLLTEAVGRRRSSCEPPPLVQLHNSS